MKALFGSSSLAIIELAGRRGGGKCCSALSHSVMNGLMVSLPLSTFSIVHSYAHKTYLFMDTIHMFAVELVVVCNEIDRSAPRCKKDRVSIGY